MRTRLICIVSEADQIPIPDDLDPATVVNPGGRGGVCLVCEHASAHIPAGMGDLGLAPADRFSHAAWDIGAEALARALSESFDAPLVAATVSRLVVDLNRPAASPEASPARVEVIDVPGNRGLTDAGRHARARAIYDPFHARVAATLEAIDASPVMVTVHSFTPRWHGAPRSTEIGLLHDADDRLARAMLAAAPEGIRVELNAPYAPSDGVMHMLQKHALPRGLRNVMIEVRNDLLGDEAGVARMAATLAAMLTAALDRTEAA